MRPVFYLPLHEQLRSEFMKRFSITALSLMFLISLSACGSKEQATLPADTAPTVAAAIASNESAPTPTTADAAAEPAADQLSELMPAQLNRVIALRPCH